MNPAEMTTAIICATKHEAAAVRRVLSGSIGTVPCGGKTATLGRLGSRTVFLITAGLGERKTERAFEMVSASFPLHLIVNFGAAGAIGEDLEIGTPTVPREILAYSWPDLKQVGRTIVQPTDGLEHLDSAIRITRAGSCPRIIRNAETRARLRESLGIDTTDLETYRLAALCQSEGIRFAALRCVTDRANADAADDYKGSFRLVLDKGAVLLGPLVEALVKMRNAECGMRNVE